MAQDTALQVIEHFYPRPPRGGRRAARNEGARTVGFLSTPSARRATEYNELTALLAEFLSTPSARRATQPFVK